jgi:iron-sulfur cluster repair protein YtfE (RIC family)
MDVIEALKADHARVIALFARVRAHAVPPRHLVAELCDRVVLHALAEEQIFYPAVVATGDRALQRWVTQSRAAHARTKAMAQMIRRTGVSNLPRLVALGGELELLEQDLQSHVVDEEARWFPLAVRRVTEQERRGLGERFAARQHELEGRRAAA